MMEKKQRSAYRGIAVVVLGMHRSGTSILTRVLNAHGCVLSRQLLGANASNPSGHWESSAAIAINDQLLGDLGRAWDDLRDLPQDWMRRPEAREAKDKIKILLEGDFRDEPLWAIKEPRMCRLAPLWIEAITELGFDVRVVMAVRHPREVALSLLRRDGLPTAHGLMLWTQYLLEAEAATRQVPRVIVSHQTVSGDWRQVAKRIGGGLGLEWPVSAESVEELLDGFISRDNIHINEVVSGVGDEAESLPGICRTLYEQTLAIEFGEQAWPEFIAVSDQVQEVARIYSPVVDELYRTIHITGQRKLDEEERLQQLGEYMLQAQGNQDALMSRLDRVAEFEARVDQTQEELAARTSERDRAIHEFELFRQWASRLEGELESLRGALAVQTARAKVGDEAVEEFARFREWASVLEGELASVRESLEVQTARAKLGDEAIEEFARFRDWASQLENELRSLRASLRAETTRAETGERVVDELGQALQSVDKQAGRLERELQLAFQRSTDLEGKLEATSQWAGQMEEELRIMQGSWSMRLTRPLRATKAIMHKLVRHIRGVFIAANHFVREPRKYFRIARNQPSAILALAGGFIGRGGPKPIEPEPVRFDLRAISGPVVVLTTRHCEYIAREIRDALARVDIASEIIFERPESGYADVPHFVICPQFFPVLPGFYVAFQMEQSVSSRWFTADYLRTLENSFAIFDYSTANIAFLKDKGISLKQVYYVPIGPLPNLLPEEVGACEVDDYDVVFYGDSNNQRRQAYLRELRKHFKVKVVSEIFGEDLYRILSGAKLVVNIHYYVGALLETTRIWECLSLGKVVVSERSSDMQDHAELQGMVDFVDIDDIPAMVGRVSHWLKNSAERQERMAANRHAIASGLNRFDYFFYRFLLATDNISFEEFWQEAGNRYPLVSDRLCLNLPEYTDRSLDFMEDNKYDFNLLPGLRHGKGWLGCAMSYKYMVRLAKEQGLAQVTICEDDVEFPPDFDEAMLSIDTYLSGREDGWDIFSGLMADLHRGANILSLDQHDGRSFVTTDRLISTVMNVYNGSVFDTIIEWDENNRDVETNTIDRYLEKNAKLKVVVTDPFLVGHKEEQSSTIWGFQNTQYADLIDKSSRLLRKKVQEFEVLGRG